MNKRNWVDLGSDVDWRNHGGMWGRPDPHGYYDWIVVQFISEESWEADPKYHCVEYGVDLDSTHLQPALECCGMTDYVDPEPHDLAYALMRYGAASVLAQVCGNNARELLKACGMGKRLK